jgi:hypothetical protein
VKIEGYRLYIDTKTENSARSLLSRATDSTIKLDFMKILHLSTYIMETRRNRNQMMFQMKRKSQNMKN